ncbi:FAD-dependent oxidoreductase [Campylobacter sp. MIT 21-1685]|uniref:NAD(P)/FAD-dependent oxidoreductase n=1 Tax=unclassified Campylobacter TaxID=2593542 RepID=UPI00224A78BB|nr:MULTISPECIES: FAD-dependent oxidoreductase [unclassified Campylobacter]MCX2682287.1 FAD-dependent oxidoreductase [Campylobacter sp. MIT 21-1684]MCX2750567.1 FAD-dependent oxidoreductase [Campylobacter sp. MIT 21-1682]MCX2806885.1 FAD-dependent oxidoreductase [Campylobacter sp. MIT 21-1685]
MKKVLILGGGYASLSFIKNLHFEQLQDFSFTLISRENRHYTSVLLHEVVSKAKNITVAYTDILPKRVHFIQDTVKEIKEKIVCTEKGEYEYDILIVGLGFASDDFKIPGVKKYCHTITNYEDCLSIYQKIQEQNRQKQKYEIIVCGGGFSGIELVGNLIKDLQFKHTITIKCIEAMPTILPMFSQNLALEAKRYLENLGVEFYIHSKIVECQENKVIIERNGQQETIHADIILWTAGVKGNEVIENSSFFHSQRSKIETDEFLRPLHQNKTMQNIFILGDCSAFKDPKTEKIVPPTAQLALQQGKYLAETFNKHDTKFSYQSKGTLCSLGDDYALGFIGSKEIKGKTASWIKKFVEFQWLFKLQGIKALF